MKYLLPTVCAILLLDLGCAGARVFESERVRTVEVRVPVAVPCPVPTRPDRPVLALASLPLTATPAEIARAYVLTVEQLTGYARELELLLPPTPRKESR